MHQARERALIEGRKPEVIKARRKPRRNLEWLQESFASIVPKEIEGYIVDRLVDGIAAATIDREMDLFSQFDAWPAICRTAPRRSAMSLRSVRP